MFAGSRATETAATLRVVLHELGRHAFPIYPGYGTARGGLQVACWSSLCICIICVSEPDEKRA